MKARIHEGWEFIAPLPPCLSNEGLHMLISNTKDIRKCWTYLCSSLKTVHTLSPIGD
jgi:hypothetical protein